MLAITLGRYLAPLLLIAGSALAQQNAPDAARDAQGAAQDAQGAAQGTQNAPQAAQGTQDAPKAALDALFATLAEENAPNPGQIQRRIAEIWSVSGSDSMDFLLSRGRAALEAEEYDKAVAHLSALITLAPDFAEAWNARATAHFLQDEFWLSVADIQQALMLEPRHFGALTGLGVILERIGEDAGALRVQREALRLNPHLDGAREAVERLAPGVDGRDI